MGSEYRLVNYSDAFAVLSRITTTACGNFILSWICCTCSCFVSDISQIATGRCASSGVRNTVELFYLYGIFVPISPSDRSVNDVFIVGSRVTSYGDVLIISVMFHYGDV